MSNTIMILDIHCQMYDVDIYTWMDVKFPLYLQGGQLPLVLWRWYVILLSQRRRRRRFTHAQLKGVSDNIVIIKIYS